MSVSTIKSGGLSMDTTDFQKFAKALRKAEPVLAKNLRVKLRAAGELVAAEARARASAFSASIPPTIKVRTSGLTVAVVAGKGAPIAALEELGNKRGGGGGTFRHPVFGNMDNWVEQPMHPYLYPALAAKAAEAEELIIDALDETIAFIVADTEG